MELYRQWLADGCHADMAYLERHLPMKENPQLLLPQARSAIVIAKDYFPPQMDPIPTSKLRTALYARSRDYHFSFAEELEKLKVTLAKEFPSEQFLCCTDSKPVAERDLAVRAGLGWIGKNGCLIDQKRGSLFFIGEIYTSLEINDANPIVADHCGTCDRCIKACPTQAIRQNRTLDARKCIAYWTIEAKAEPPEEIRPQFHDWFFGCDVCQTVCPWNEKAFDKSTMRELSRDFAGDDVESQIRWCLTSSNREIEESLSETPLLRARARGLRRNALIVAANRKLKRLIPEVEQTAKSYPQLSELVRWTLEQLSRNS